MSKERLLRLLQKPRHYEPKERAWKRLTTGSELYRALKQAIQKGPIDDAPALLESWKTFVEFGTDETRRQWDLAHRLVFCAAESAKTTQTETIAQSVSKDSVWWRICANTFLTQPIRELRLPIAGVDRFGSGFTATLHLQLFSGDNGLIHHPIDTFSTTVDEAFERSMLDAWESAQTQAKELNPASTNFDGCWRVLDVHDVPITELNGASASGSAAAGWLQMLGYEQAHTDDRVIVLARSDRQGGLTEVEGITAKAKAVVAGQYIDTIIVAGPANQREAEAGIRQVENNDRIQVLCHDKLGDACTSRSRLASGLIDYCISLAAELDQTDWHGPNKDRVKISEIAVPSRFIPVVNDLLDETDDEGRNEDPIAVESMPVDLPSIDDKPEVSFGQLDPDFNLDPLSDSYVVESYDDVGSVAKGEFSWGDIWPAGFQQLVLLRGEPGSGKTVHTMFAAITAAESLARRLMRREVSVNELTGIPIWIPLTKLARAGLAKDTAMAILGSLEEHFNKVQLDPDVRAFIKSRLPDHAVLFFDGLDELYDRTQIDQIRSRFRDMQEWQSPICVTCRTGYDTSMLPNSRVSEYKLADFRWAADIGRKREVEAFISNWFASQSASARELLDILKLNSAIHQQCHSPLLLTLTCLAHQSRAMTDQTNSADLYASVLRDLLRGKWRIDTGPLDISYDAFRLNDEEQLVDCARTCLSHMAERLAAKGLTRNRFPSSELLEAMESAPLSSRPSNPRQALVWFQTRGVLVKNGFDRDEPCYSFIHRTIFEYLIAQGLKVQPDCSETIKSGLIAAELSNTVAWCNILPLLIASVNDPETFLSILIDLCNDDHFFDRRDTFRRTLISCLLETRTPLEDFELREAAFEAVLKLVDEPHRKHPDEWRLLLEGDEMSKILSAVDKHYGAAREVELVRNVLSHVQAEPGTVRSRNPTSLMVQLDKANIAQHPAAPMRWAYLKADVLIRKSAAIQRVPIFLKDKSPVVRSLACRASIVRNQQIPFEALKEILLNDRDAYARGGAAGALGRLRDDRAIPYLTPLCSPEAEPERTVRGPAMWAIAQLCNPQRQDLAEIVKAGLNDVDTVQTSAIHGLVELGRREMAPTLISKLEDCEMPNVRKQAAWALGRFAVPEAVPALVKGLSDSDKSVADKCYSAIMNYALDQARPQVEAFIQNADEHQKRLLAFTWRESIKRKRPRNPQHYEVAAWFCLDMTRDPSPKVRETACLTLTVLMRFPALGAHTELIRAAAEQGLALMEDPEQRVRTFACGLLAQVTRLKPEFLIQDRQVVRRIIVQALSILRNSDDPQVQEAACRILVELARAGTPVITENELIVQRILREAFRLANTVAPQLKVSALMAFQALLSSETLEVNERLSRQVASVTLDLFEHSSSGVRLTSLIALKSLLNATTLQETLARKAVFSVIGRLHDPIGKVRTSAAWVLAHMAKRQLPPLTDPDPMLAEAVRSLRDLLENESSPHVLTYTLKTFEFLVRVPSVRENEELIQLLVERSLEILTTGSIPRVRTSALCLLHALLKFPNLLNNKPFQVGLAHQCLSLLETPVNAQKVKKLKKQQREFRESVALATLGVLVSMPSVMNNSELIEKILGTGLRFTNNESARVSTSALSLLLAVTQTNSTAFTMNKDLARALVERGRAMLINPLSHVRSTSFMLLENVVVQNYATDERVISQIAEHCVKSLKDPEQEVRAAALRVLERVLERPSDSQNSTRTHTDVFPYLLKAADDNSPSVRSAAYGVVGNLLDSSDTDMARSLIDRALEAAHNEAPSVRKSAIWQLDSILTKTDLNSDPELTRIVMDKLIALLRSPESGEVRVVTLRTLENILMQTALRENESAARKIIDETFVLLNEPHPKVRIAALRTFQTMTRDRLQAFVKDDVLVTKLIDRSLAFVNLGDGATTATIFQILAGLVRLRGKKLFSDTQTIHSIIDSAVKLLEPSDAKVQVSACRLLTTLFDAEQAPVFAERTMQTLAQQSTRLIAGDNEKLQVAAAALLARLVSQKSHDISKWEEGLLQDICELGKALLCESKPVALKNALNILTALNALPPGDEKTAKLLEIQGRALTLMNHPDQTVQITAINLLAKLLSRNVDVWRTDVLLVKQVAQKSLQLFESDPGPNVQVSACWLLCLLSRNKLQGFIDDEQLVNATHHRATLIDKNNNANLQKNARALLRALPSTMTSGVVQSQSLANL